MEVLSPKECENLMAQSIHLRQCPHCRGRASIHVAIPLYGLEGAYVKCDHCGIQTEYQSINVCVSEKGTSRLCTPVVPEALLAGVLKAIKIWNGITKEEM